LVAVESPLTPKTSAPAAANCLYSSPKAAASFAQPLVLALG